MPDKLKEFIAQNREQFHTDEPSAGLWNKINDELHPQKPVKKLYARNSWLWMAASVMLLAVCFGLFWQLQEAKKQLKNYTVSNVSQNSPSISNEALPTEIQEFEMYYNYKSDDLLAQLASYPEEAKDVQTELNELDAEFETLKNSLGTNLSDSEIIEAMIDNYREKLEILERTLHHIKKSENKNNETFL